MIRSFDIRDIPLFKRYHRQGLFLDNIRTLTWGTTSVPIGAAISPLSAAMGIFTSLYQFSDEDKHRIIGQVTHVHGSQHARLAYLAPESDMDAQLLTPLLNDLIHRVGERGAQNLLAEVDEKKSLFEALRRSHFSIFARQHIWQINRPPRATGEAGGWRDVLPIDEINVRKLYNELVPGLVQQVEPPPWQDLRGYAYYQQGELLAYTQVISGPYGIWMQPFIHPEMDDVGPHLIQLIADLHPKKNRPLYLCLRSYQSWLSLYMNQLDAQCGPSQAVMVRRLTAAIKKPALAPLPKLNGGTEPTTTYYEIQSEHEPQPEVR